MTVCGERRSTFAESADRTRRLANFLAGNGFGAHRERGELESWECGQDRVALIMHNDLYPDMVIGCLKARTVPVNVNYNYTPREVARTARLPATAGRHLPPVAGRRSSPTYCRPPRADLLISVDDGSDAPELPGATQLDDALAQGDTDHDIDALARRSVDDLHRWNDGAAQGRPVAAERHATSCR